MKEEYLPNEKYRNMFGVERNGYGCQRVDLYLAQLEVAFKKIREDNRSLKRELAGQNLIAPAPPEYASRQAGFSLFPPDNELAAQLEQQGQYIMQLQAQLAEQQDRSRLLAERMAQPPENPQAAEALLAQIAALRGEADALRQQLRGPVQVSEEEQQNLIGKVLVEARAQAEELVRAARQESEAMLNRARKRVDELRAEQERVRNQLQGISYGLRSVLRENIGERFADPTGDYKAGPEYQQRGEEYAAS